MHNTIAPAVSVTAHICFGPDDTPFESMRTYLDSLWSDRLSTVFRNKLSTPDLYILKTRESLFDAYLKGFPEERRQHHNCHNCRKFIETMGALGELKVSDGLLVGVPVFFSNIDIDDIPDYYRQSIKNIRDAITPYVSTPLILDRDYKFNKGVTGVWSHFSVPKDYQQSIFKTGRKFSDLDVNGDGRSSTAIAAVLTSNYQILSRAIAAVSVETALHVNALFQSDRYLSNVRSSFQDQMDTFALLTKLYASTKNSGIRENLLWNTVVGGDPAIISFHNTLVGKLCLDIQSGDFAQEKAISVFMEAAKGENYQRPKGDPSEGLLKVAEMMISSMGLEKSFERRFLNRDEIDPAKAFSIWQKPEEKVEEVAPSKSAVIDRVQNRLSEDFPHSENLKKTIAGGKISVDRFFRILRSEVTAVQLVVPPRSKAWTFYTTAVHEDAPILIRYDSIERRNPVIDVSFVDPTPCGVFGFKAYDHIDVVGVGRDCEYWGDTDNPKQSQFPILYLSDGSMQALNTSAIFPVVVIPELRPIRKVIEKISDTGKIEASDKAQIAYRMYKGIDQGVSVIVEKDGTKTLYQLGMYEDLDNE